MKAISRDISLTLTVKLVLLFILWYVCFKGMHKPTHDISGWLLGSHSSSPLARVDNATSKSLGKHKYRSVTQPSKKGDL